MRTPCPPAEQHTGTTVLPVRYAAEAVTDRLNRTLWYAPLVVEKSDEDALRQMRVWSRRARAALEAFAFCLGRAELRPLRREVRAVTRALGQVRDLDMMAELLARRAQSVPAGQQAVVEDLLKRLRERRREMQHTVVKAVERFTQRRPLDLLADSVARRTGGRRSQVGAAPAHLLVSAGRAIGERARDVVAYEKCLGDPRRSAELHEMRAAVKRLRYTIEVFEPIYREYTSQSDRLAAALVETEALQDRLGRIHDADVLVPWLTEQVGALLHEGMAVASGGASLTGVHLVDYDAAQAILALCQACREDRQRHFRRLQEHWERLQRTGFFDELRSTLRAAIGEAAAPAEARELQGQIAAGHCAPVLAGQDA